MVRRVLPPLAVALVCAGCFADEPPTITGADASSGAASTGAVTDGSTAGSSSATSSSSSTSTGGSTGVSSACGDGLVDPGEECDDGGLVAGDGCSPQCSLEPLLAFVTKGRINGNAGTSADVDAKCQSEATAHGLSGTYYAWLSFDEASSPALRFAVHERPYVLPGPDMPVVAVGLDDLLSGNHEHEINRGPDGVVLPPKEGCSVDSLVWTGTTNDGKVHASNCKGFTSADMAEKGNAGRFSGNGIGWSAHCVFECNNSLPFYCFQQP